MEPSYAHPETGIVLIYFSHPDARASSLSTNASVLECRAILRHHAGDSANQRSLDGPVHWLVASDDAGLPRRTPDHVANGPSPPAVGPIEADRVRDGGVVY
jgi:hypothetical protein